MKDQQQERAEIGLLSSFIALYSEIEETIDAANLLCNRIQKTVDAGGRLQSVEDEKETLFEIMMSLEEHCRSQHYPKKWWDFYYD